MYHYERPQIVWFASGTGSVSAHVCHAYYIIYSRVTPHVQLQCQRYESESDSNLKHEGTTNNSYLLLYLLILSVNCVKWQNIILCVNSVSNQ